MSLVELSASEAVEKIAQGEITAESYMDACCARIEESDGPVGAWAFFDPEAAREAARGADALRQSGARIGPLHGLPVAVKDIVDTAGMPTEYGSPIHAGRVPNKDAALVTNIRDAGGIVMGKTVTTEFAYFQPGKTANPHNPAHTPGGSSSGSAAAVAALMAPAAIGSQTNGSVIRPASFCGVHGYKPSFGTISRRNVLPLSSFLDTMGVFARSVDDLALMGEALSAHDPGDPFMTPGRRLRLRETARSEPPVEPVLAFVRTAAWDRGDDDMKAGFGELCQTLGNRVDEVDLPAIFDAAWGHHRAIMTAEMAKALGPTHDRAPGAMSDILVALIEEGRKVPAVDYMGALSWRDLYNGGLDQLFDRYDAIITPAAPGEAPEGLDATGDPSFCSLWTLCGCPAVSLPLLAGENGLPVGVQVVGRVGDDARLLRTARWLENTVAGGGG